MELAIAVLVLGLLIGSMSPSLLSHTRARKFAETQRILAKASEALLGYAAANGYFPCPASSTSNGVEVLTTPGDHTSLCHSSVNGTNVYIGFLPAVTLGFEPIDANGYAIDAWDFPQSRIRYAVANANVNGWSRPFTRPDGMRNATMGAIAALEPTPPTVVSTSPLLHVCKDGNLVTASGCTNANNDLATNAIVVIWSLGENLTTGGTAPHEDKNLDNDRVFVLAPYSTVAGSIFDDQLIWIGTSTVFGKLIAAGMLP